MARCEQGYLCEVCGGDVGEITDSDLYLRYVLGAIGPGELMHTRERHIRCNPVQAQYIVDDRFEPVFVEGPFDKRLQEADATRDEETRITRAWRRLQEIPGLGIPITEYPLPEVRARQRSDRS
jgi:hypothetical protein